MKDKVTYFVSVSSSKGGIEDNLDTITSELDNQQKTNIKFFLATEYIQTINSIPQPDLIVLFGSFYSSNIDIYSLISLIRSRENINIAAWISTDPFEFDYNFLLPTLVDFVFTNDYNSCKYYQSQKVYHLPPTAFPQIDFSINLKTDFSWDVAVYGNATPNSISVLHTLKILSSQYSILVIGDNWDKRIISDLDYISGNSNQKTKAILSTSKIILNLSSPTNICNSVYEIVPSTPDQSIFDLASMEVCQFVFFAQPELYRYFADNEIITFSNKSELINRIKEYSKDKNLRKSIAIQSRQNIIKNHSFLNRYQQILKYIFK